MAILDYFSPGEFFTTVDPNRFCPGQFCYVVVPHIEPIPRILDVERRNPEEHDQVRFELRPGNKADDFRKQDRSLPIKNLNLRSHEELLTQRAKRRPGIILTTKVDKFPEIDVVLRRMGKRHLQEEVSFVLPCYSIQSAEDRNGFPPEMVSRIRCLMYRQFFYFPGNHEIKEGVIRLDRVRVVVGKDPSAVKPVKTCLSESVFAILQALFVYCITGIENPDLETLRSLTMAAFPREES